MNFISRYRERVKYKNISYKIYTYYYFLYYEQRSELQTKLSVCGRTEFKKLSLALLADTGGL